MSSALNKRFITLIACLFVISTASAKPAQTDIGLNEHGLTLSKADGNISPNLGLKIAKPNLNLSVKKLMAGRSRTWAVQVEHRESYQRRLATNAQASGADIRFTYRR